MTAKILDNRYKLLKKIGVGGFGHTFIARDMRRPGTPACVVKQLQPANKDESFIREARRLFNTEAETLERLGRHDQIPQLLAYFEENQEFYLVQEFIEGKSLYQEWKADPDAPEPTDGIRRGKAISEADSVQILKDVLNVLEFVHAEGVIHRDIKPDNLIRRKSDNRIVLIDFGAVKAMQDGQAKIETSNGESRFTVTIGTPGYMPSEQSAGRPNFASDIYALGMVVIRGLTGVEPTDLPTNVETGEVQWRDFVKVSNGLGMVLTRMVRYKFSDRYESVKDVKRALTSLMVEESSTLAPTQLVPQTRIPGKGAKADLEHRLPISGTSARSSSSSSSGLLFGGLFLVLVALGAIAVPLLSRRPSPPSPPVASPPNLTAPNPPPPNPGVITSPSIRRQPIPLQPATPLQLTGTLPPSTTLVFTFPATSGQAVLANVAGVGLTLELRNATRGSFSFGSILPESGEYEVSLTAAPGNEGQALPYSLTVELTGGSNPSVPENPNPPLQPPSPSIQIEVQPPKP
ncbi:MAG: serine/threonine protein kinase [Oscillatoriales cyanobacterium SM2_2_1]|nr:serine/threonine protein kinase [Oscillatoriales cyanobacterium SM2_2_1]